MGAACNSTNSSQREVQQNGQSEKVNLSPTTEKDILLGSGMDRKVFEHIVNRTVRRMEKSMAKAQREREQAEDKIRAQIAGSFDRLTKEIDAKYSEVECLVPAKFSKLEESLEKTKTEIESLCNERNDSVSKNSKDCEELSRRTRKVMKDFTSLKKFTSNELARHQGQSKNHAKRSHSNLRREGRSSHHYQKNRSHQPNAADEKPSTSVSAASSISTSGGGKSSSYALWPLKRNTVK